MSGTYLSHKTVKAKKPCRCELCGLPIAAGEMHYTQRMIWEGQACTWRAHSACTEVTKSWSEDDWENQDVTEFRKELAEFNAKKEATRAQR